MGLRWDWLHPVMTAPHVPALGPVHPAAVTPGLFGDVIGIAGTGRFLSHDKDRRWAGRKDEHVLAGAIIQEPGLVLIPALSTRRTSCVKIHVYSQDPRGALSRADDVAMTERLLLLVWYGCPVIASGMTEDGYIPVDSATLETRFPNVWALGDGAHQYRQVVFEPELVVRQSSRAKPRPARRPRG